MLVALAIAAVVVVVLVASQILLPRIAADEVRSRIGPDGQGLSVKVSAFPAIQLLWHHADAVTIRLGEYRTPPDDVPGLLQEAGDVGTLKVSIGTLHSGKLTLHDVKLTKTGAALVGSARVEESDLGAALPVIDSVTPISGADGQLTLRGTGGAFGITATVTAVVTASDGKVIVAPAGLLGDLVNITVFNDPGIYVESVTGAAVSGGLTVSVRAELRN
jgi:hypothetical protein